MSSVTGPPPRARPSAPWPVLITPPAPPTPATPPPSRAPTSRKPLTDKQYAVRRREPAQPAPFFASNALQLGPHLGLLRVHGKRTLQRPPRCGAVVVGERRIRQAVERTDRPGIVAQRRS